MALISKGEFDIKYIYFFFAYLFLMLSLYITLLIIYKSRDKENNVKVYYNILLILFLDYMSQALCFIPEKTLNKKIYGKATNLNLNKEQKSPFIIKYIYNNLSNKIAGKDIIFIIIANLAGLIIGFTKVKIFSEQLNFSKLFFLFLFSYLIYKTKFYKHQYFSIFLIFSKALLAIYLFFFIKKNEMNGYILQLIIQIIIVWFESLILVYIKGLM